jgi:hypothetical protein
MGTKPILWRQFCQKTPLNTSGDGAKAQLISMDGVYPEYCREQYQGCSGSTLTLFKLNSNLIQNLMGLQGFLALVGFKWHLNTECSPCFAFLRGRCTSVPLRDK